MSSYVYDMIYRYGTVIRYYVLCLDTIFSFTISRIFVNANKRLTVCRLVKIADRPNGSYAKSTRGYIEETGTSIAGRKDKRAIHRNTGTEA